jgi:hypothetical protein
MDTSVFLSNKRHLRNAAAGSMPDLPAAIAATNG